MAALERSTNLYGADHPSALGRAYAVAEAWRNVGEHEEALGADHVVTRTVARFVSP